MSLDQKTDKNAVQTQLLVAENVQMNKTGKLQKSYGFDAFSSRDASNDLITDMIQLSNFNDELILLTKDRLYSYGSSNDRWSDKEECVAVETTTYPIVANSYEQTQVDMAIAGNKALYAWRNSSGVLQCKVVDMVSGATIINETGIDGGGTRPRCVGLNGQLFLFWARTSNNTLYCSKAESAAFSTPVAVVTDLNGTDSYYDVCVLGQKMVVAYCDTSNDLGLLYFLQTMEPGNTLNGSPDPIVVATEDPDQAITVTLGIQPSPTSLVPFHVVWSNSVAGVKTMGFYSDFTTYKAAAVVDIETDVRNVGAVAYSTKLDIYFEIDDGASGFNNIVSNNLFNVSANTAATTSIVQRAAGLISKPFLTTDDLSSVAVSYQSADLLQDTYFVVDRNGIIDTKILPTIAGGHSTIPSHIGGVWTYGDSLNFAGRRKTRNVTAGEVVYSLTGLNRIELNYESIDLGLADQLGGNLHIPGGFLKVFDGQSVVEHQYHMYPEGISIATSASGTGVANGTYQYIVIWNWTDSQGQICRSQTSLPEVHVVSGGPKDVTVTIPTLRYTAKRGSRTAPTIEVYRTETLGSIFYKVSSDTSPTYNDPTVDTITFTDAVSDTTLITREPLYTTGGGLDNTAAPAVNLVQAVKNRLFVVGEDPNTLIYSKLWGEGQCVSFSGSEFSIPVPRKGGRITALAEMDEKLIIFKETTAYYLTGDGPNNFGSGGQFTIEAIATDVGTVEPKSVVSYIDGLVFKSAKGIYKLSRALESVYVGAPVEDYNALSITSAVVVADQNQIRFTTESGTTLTYNYYYNMWFTQTNMPCVSATNYAGSYTWLRNTDLVMTENRSSYSINGAAIRSKIQTGFIAAAGIQGFQRLRAFTILGDYLAASQFRAKISYNYVDSPAENWMTNLTAYDSVYGEEVYGDQSPYGGIAYPTFQFRFQPAIQKCESFSITLEDAFPDSVPSAAFTLSQLSLELALKTGNFKMPNSQTIRS